MRNLRQWDPLRQQLYGNGMSYGTFKQFDTMAGWEFDHIESEPSEIIYMSGTGLKDKNGKEIYEGDVLDCTCESLTNFGRTRTGKWTTTYYEVLWDGEGWSKKVLKSELLVVGKISDGIAISAKYSVVIGNIYENPSLLEASQ